MSEAEFEKKNRNEILVVDDDEIVLYIHQIVLEQLKPVSVSAFLSAGLALEYLSLPKKKDTKFLILLDINMPIVDGWGMLELLKTDPLAAYISVIMVSSSSDVNDIKRSSDYAMVIDYISKPLSEEKLLSVLLETPFLQNFLTNPSSSFWL